MVLNQAPLLFAIVAALSFAAAVIFYFYLKRRVRLESEGYYEKKRLAKIERQREKERAYLAKKARKRAAIEAVRAQAAVVKKSQSKTSLPPPPTTSKITLSESAESKTTVDDSSQHPESIEAASVASPQASSEPQKIYSVVHVPVPMAPDPVMADVKKTLDDVKKALQEKRVVAEKIENKQILKGNVTDSMLLKILDRPTVDASKDKEEPARKTKLPPPPSRRLKQALVQAVQDEINGPTGTLEAVIVQMYEGYLGEIASFQRQLSNATSAGEIINKTCKALASLANKSRVVYMEYQAPQRALMVSSRSTPEVFAGTQPRMFLPLPSTATKSLPVEELREVVLGLSKDAELQRLLKDSCLLESRSTHESDPDKLWIAQRPWKIYPFYVRGVPLGVFALQENSVCQRREFQNLIDIFLAHSSSAVENIRLHSKMVEVSARDAVTGLQTRKAFQERLYESFLIARRLRHPLTVLRVEVDQMGAYTSQYGVQVAEAIMRHVTRHLSRFFRKSDIMARYSQEGFGIILPHTALVDALKKTDLLVEAVRESSLQVGRDSKKIDIKVSVSVGLAEFPSHVDTPADLLRFANEALYRGQGRERAAVSLAKVPAGYVPPFNSRFVRSAPKTLQENAVSPILDS